MTNNETLDTSPEKEEEEKEDVAGVMYWGVESRLHRLCLEADQKPKHRTWEDIQSWIEENMEDAKHQCVLREGDLKLTPLAIVCQEAPLSLVRCVLQTNPAAALLTDKYGGLPLHRCALQNRTPDVVPVCQLLIEACRKEQEQQQQQEKDVLQRRDGWSRTPLLCAVESGRGPGTIAMLEVLNGGPEGDEVIHVENKRGQTPLDKVQTMKQFDPVIYEWLESHFTV